jgi:hypothetical protein
MNGKRHPLRAVLVGLGSLILTAGSNGCSSAPEQTSQSSQDLFGCPWCHIGPYVITALTSTPVPNGATCGSDTIAIPTALQNYGCTAGVAIYNDPNLNARTFSNGVQAYAWACSTSLNVTALTNAVVSGGFGGPEPSGSLIMVNTAAQSVDSCYGYPDSGYSIVLEQPVNYACVPIGFELTTKDVGMPVPGWHPFVQICQAQACDCPPGTVMVQ